MELFFLALLMVLMAGALASGFPVAFALPGSAILTIGSAAMAGFLLAGDAGAYFAHGGPVEWLSAGVTNFRGVYWEVERDTLIAIPLFVFMGIMLQRSKIAEDLLVTMAQLFGAIPGGLGISVVFVGGLLAATTGIVGATVVAMGLISLPAMLRNNYAKSLASGTIAASGTLGQIIPPSIVLIILADQLSNATDQASTLRKSDYVASTGEFTLPSAFDVTSTSAGDMFLGAFVPGLLLVGIYMLFILGLALLRPKMAPAVPHEGKYDRHFAFRVFLALVPPLALIFAVLGSIIAGVATVNQAGAIGAAGAAIMAGYRLKQVEGGGRTTFIPSIMAVISITAIFYLIANYDLNVKNIDSQEDMVGIVLAIIAVVGLLTAILWSGWRIWKIDNTLRDVMIETAKTTSLVFIILLGAAMLTAAFRAFGGEELVREFLTGLPGGFWTQFVVVMAVIFIMGFFLDFIEIAVVVVPIVSPILLADPQANVTAVWLGVMIGLNIQTSFLTPPFGFALFYLRGVAPPTVRTVDMYKGVIPFICLQLIGLAIVGLTPTLVNYLPTRVSLTAETAPPPKNPKLQACLEDYIFVQYQERGDEIRAAIDRARGLDISYLPDDLREPLRESYDAAESTFELVAAIKATEDDIQAALPEYRPLHTQVRNIERNLRSVERQLEDVRQELQNLQYVEDATEEDRLDLQEDVADLEAEREDLESQIPGDWTERHKDFAKLLLEQKKARGTYQRNVDDAYEALMEMRAALSGTERLAELGDDIRALAEPIASAEPVAAGEAVDAVEDRVGDIEGAGEIRSLLAKARRSVDDEEPDRAAAQDFLRQAITAYEANMAWRRKAEEVNLEEKLAEYDAAIRDTIGVRSLDRVPSDIASDIAGCLAEHRDISLYF